MDIILEFLHQLQYHTTTENMMLKWFTTKDYCLYQFQAFVGKKIEELDTYKNRK